ncbi:conserved membrane hypothetical protein [uncultured Desulfatiglans sp.]|uniref:Yip1 domain-containing protein n=1 Tax=Uncultured Desulfatiglans sp. TaxID=1748965 RepID=A0A653A567_UNCDX|nr:conserved membrane hypothetical protein [uncultured Desulfatiglans sp.]
MSMTQTLPDDAARNRPGFDAVRRFLEKAIGLLINPGRFYEARKDEKGYRTAISFLLTVSILFTLAGALVMPQEKAFFAVVFFLNAFSMPFLTAGILYPVARLFCRRTFTFEALFRIVAYANVSLLISWLPGMAWVGGIWKFYLIGVGMTRTGGIKTRVVLACLAAAAVLLLLLIHLLKPLISA